MYVYSQWVCHKELELFTRVVVPFCDCLRPTCYSQKVAQDYILWFLISEVYKNSATHRYLVYSLQLSGMQYKQVSFECATFSFLIGTFYCNPDQKKKENNFQFYVWKVRRVHSKYLLWAAHSKPKPLKATQRILDTMTDKDRQTDWQIGWYFVGGQNYFASTAAPQTVCVCVCVDSCTCWGIGHRHRHGHENMSREGWGEGGRESKVCAEFLYALKYMQTDRETDRETDGRHSGAQLTHV